MSKLHEIAAQRRKDVAAAKQAVALAELQQRIKDKAAELGGPAQDLAARMAENPPISGAKMHVAAEFKRASPSKGAMAAEGLSVEDQVTTYVRAGASVISVLTEPKWFKGTLEDMELAKKTVIRLAKESRPLVLRKDFLVDSYQLYEARAYGADTVLLIVAILTDEELKSLISESRELGMEPLVEAANEEETKRALACGAKVLGINNRDLTTFKVDLGTTNRCAALVDPTIGVSILSLSGMKGRDDVVPYESLDVVRGVLVGEHLMRCDNPIKEIQALVTSIPAATESIRSLVKVCGMVRPEDALDACRAKTDMIGIIFAEKSPRNVDVEQAKKIAEAVRNFRETKSSIAIELPPKFDHSAKRTKLTNWFTEASEKLRKACTRGPLLVGVFMNQSIEFVNEAVKSVGLDLVQLHGNETPEECAKCVVPVIKVVHIPVGQSITDEAIVASVQSYEGAVISILLDTTVKGGAEGGTGVAFDWLIADRYRQLGVPVIVAGGLTAENVKEAVVTAKGPLGVDCCSGVQKDDKTPREKDPSLVKAFIERARSAL